MRVVRGMVGTGLTFAVGVGVVGSILGLIGMLFGVVALDDFRMVAKMSVVSFLLGMLFSGVLAVAARRRTFEKLSLGYVTALGAGGGLLYFLFIGFMNGFSVWRPPAFALNLTLLTGLGGALAGGTLLLARKARAALTSREEPPGVGEGSIETPLVRREAKVKSARQE